MLVFLAVLAAAVVMILVEFLRPARNWPRVRGWWVRAVLVNAVQVGFVFVAGLVWDKYFSKWRPWSADSLGVTWGAILGYVVITFIYYWWHRWRHEVPFLWRWMHQFHHSPQRIEVITSFYKHPLEIFANSILSSAIAYLLVGLGPKAGAGAVLLTGLAELFYHWNVRTPYWLGYIIQRPESHCVHHQEGIHHYNFSDLPLWDMLFGTFHNPRAVDFRCGFGNGEQRIAEMLRGIDITGVGATTPAHPGRGEQASVRRDVIAAGLLLILGLAQMAGDILHIPALKGVAAATGASPAPKVFSAVKGLETYSTRFYLEWDVGRDGVMSVQLTPEIYSRFRGPYNRRNVYGAALAYGPVLATDPNARPMLDSVFRFSLSGDAPLLKEIGIDDTGRISPVRVRYEPVQGTNLGNLPTMLEAP